MYKMVIFDLLYTARIPPKPHASSMSGFQVLPNFISPEYGTSYRYQDAQIPQPQTLGLENALEKWYIDDCELSQQGTTHSEIEHTVSGQGQFSSEYAFALASTREGVEHVEKYEAGKRHGGIAGADDLVVRHLVEVDAQST